MISDDELSIEFHRATFGGSIATQTNPATGQFFEFQSQDTHMLSVIQAVLDIHFEIAELAPSLKRSAYFHMMQGAGARSKFIWSAMRQIYSAIPPDRTIPLNLDEAYEASRSLNDIYIHTRGIIDNYSWVIRHQFGDAELKAFSERHMDLFGEKFAKNKSAAAFAAVAASYANWYRDVKTRRDPVAHRIPLSVVPSVYTEADIKLRAELQAKYDEEFMRFTISIQSGLPDGVTQSIQDKCEGIQRQIQNIGTYNPLFLHNPEDIATPIYPLIPTDMGILVRCLRVLNTSIRRRI